MSQHPLPRLLTSAALLALTLSVIAQTATSPTLPPDTTAPRPPRQHRPRPKPTNLQVLPMTYTGDQVIEIMHKFEGELGVECEYCHTKNPNPTPTTGHLDFASDANPMKDRARVMMRMTENINQNFLTQLKTPPAGNPVTCGTCHRGNAKPTVFVPPPEEHRPQGPPPSGPPPAAAPPQ